MNAQRLTLTVKGRCTLYCRIVRRAACCPLPNCEGTCDECCDLAPARPLLSVHCQGSLSDSTACAAATTTATPFPSIGWWVSGATRMSGCESVSLRSHRMRISCPICGCYLLHTSRNPCISFTPIDVRNCWIIWVLLLPTCDRPMVHSLRGMLMRWLLK